MMKRRGLCTTRTIVGALVLTMGAITTSTIAQEIGLADGSKNSLRLNQGPINTGLDCPATVVDADGSVHMTQNANIWIDDETTVACGVAGVGTTPNGWARCFDLVAEGINGDLQVDVVYFGVQQATIDDILVNVNLYISNVGCNLDSAVPPDAQATLVATGSRLVGTADALGGLKPVYFDGVVIPAGSTLIIEIESPGDGTEEPTFSFRPRSNAQGECAPSYLRADACGIPGWIGTEAIGFPDSQVVIKCLGQEIVVDDPEGDTCDDCIPVGEGVFFGNTDDNSADADICGYAGDIITEWYCYTASCTGTATVNTCGAGTDFDTTLAMLDSCTGGAQCNDDSCGLQSQIQFPVVAGGTYLIRVAGFGGGTGNYELSIECTEPQPSGCSDCTVLNDGITFGSTIGAPTEEDLNSCTFGGPSATETVWYCYTATCDGEVSMDTCGNGTDYDTVLGAWTACPEDGGQQIACNDDDPACSAFRSSITFPATAGTTYFIRVSGFANTEGNFELNVSCGGGPPPPCGENCGTGNCLEANGTPGCEDDDCCFLICGMDPFCCDVTWDSLCADTAALQCGPLCSGEPNECGENCGIGDCVDPNGNGSPGCEDDDCCFLVCGIDPFCCDVTWDGLCAATAAIECGKLCSGGPPPPGGCDVTCGDDCNKSGDTQLTQNSNCTIEAGTGIACGGGGTTTENYFARSYTMEADMSITCVGFGIETNNGGAPHPATISVYLDTNGGEPDSPVGDLLLLGSVDVLVTNPLEMLYGNFDPPIQVNAGDQVVVEIFITNGQLSDPLTGIWPGSNLSEACGASYIKSESCGLTAYTDLAAIGFPDNALVNTINGFSGGAAPPCPWDLDGDRVISTSDLIILFSQWGLAGSADFDGSGDVGTSDLLILFANWGPCP